jgi:hypothetical protein
MCFRLKQETLASEHKSKVMNMLAELELGKRKSCDINSELQRDEQTTCELLERTKDIRGLNGSVEPEVRVTNNMVPAWWEERWYVLLNTTTAW